MAAGISGEFLAGALGSPYLAYLVVPDAALVTAWPTKEQIEEFGEDIAWQNFGEPIVLRGRDLRYGDFFRTNFTRADLVGANLQDAYLYAANLEDADLTDANLEDADLVFANLQRANLRGANLTVANFQGADLEGANLQGATIGQTNLQGAMLAGANLQGAILPDADLQGAILYEANLQGAIPQSANLQGAILAEANLQGATLFDTNLQGASLYNANLQGATLASVNLQGADLREAGLWRVRVDDRINWHLADLRGIDVVAIKDEVLDDLIAESVEGIADEEEQSQLRGLLQRALRDYDRPATPNFPEEWKSKPNVMLDWNTPLAKELGWSKPMTEEAYDKELAAFLGELACGKNAMTELAAGIGGRALYPEEDRPLSRILADRLTDPSCQPAASLPEPLLIDLEQLAAGVEPPPPFPEPEALVSPDR